MGKQVASVKSAAFAISHFSANHFVTSQSLLADLTDLSSQGKMREDGGGES